MARSERVAVSGAALALLLHECAATSQPQEGFLLGNVTKNVTNHISDTQQDNKVTDVAFNIVSMLPCPDVGIFYNPSGHIKEREMRDLLSDLAPNVLGWYKYRPNGSLKSTLRDKIISKELQKKFRHQNQYFMYCNIICKQNLERSTHTYSYRFSKLDDRGNMSTIEDITNNLGEKVSGYKSGVRSERNDPFNIAVRNAAGEGMDGITNAIEGALSSVAAEANTKEKDIQKLTIEIRDILKQLAEHYRSKSILDAVQRETIVQEEREHVEPVVNSLNAEPFSFINDIIQCEVKPKIPANEPDNSFKKQKNSHNQQNDEYCIKSPSSSSDIEIVIDNNEFPPLDRMETYNRK